jgi:hypothetical protein
MLGKLARMRWKLASHDPAANSSARAPFSPMTKIVGRSSAS